MKMHMSGTETATIWSAKEGVYNGKVVYLEDPDNNTLEFIESARRSMS
jgi:hypothetical protein